MERVNRSDGTLEEAAQHLQAGRPETAAALYRKALAADPEAAGAVQGLAVVALHDGRADEAAALFRQALAREPHLAKALGNLANTLRRTSPVMAEAAFRRALTLDPYLAEVHHNLGNLLASLGRAEEAELRRSRAAALFAGREVARGAALRAGGSPAEAARAFEKAIGLTPDRVDAFVGLATLRADRGDATGAEAAARRVVALAPDHGGGYRLLGEATTDWFLAPHLLHRAALLRTDAPEAWGRLGIALGRVRRHDEADRAHRRSLALSPAMTAVFMNRSATLCGLARAADAVAVLERALLIEPDNADAHRNLLLCLMYVRGIDTGRLFAEHHRYAERHAPKLAALARPHANIADPERRLRIGYVSSDLCGHPVGRNLLPVVEAHDRTRFDLAFYADVPREDSVTERFRALAGLWRTITGRSDAEVAEMVRADGVDILVVLAGRFDRNRPLVAAARPAPVQVSFHDAATSGLAAMDYLIGDRVLNPRGGGEGFTERVIRLPSFYLHAPLEEAPPPGPPPMLRQGRVTFGSFNNPAKVNGDVLALWARVLHAVPDSRLVLKYMKQYAMPELADELRRTLERHGVDPARLVLAAAAQDLDEHLGIYRGIDIALDTFPFSGSTTTFEALWMGVPVVTLAGATMISRWSASMLAALKLDALVAETDEGYVAAAAALAADHGRLSALRAGLRDRLVASPLCAPRLKTRHIERAYRAMWRRWCRDVRHVPLDDQSPPRYTQASGTEMPRMTRTSVA